MFNFDSKGFFFQQHSKIIGFQSILNLSPGTPISFSNTKPSLYFLHIFWSNKFLHRPNTLNFSRLCLRPHFQRKDPLLPMMLQLANKCDSRAQLSSRCLRITQHPEEEEDFALLPTFRLKQTEQKRPQSFLLSFCLCFSRQLFLCQTVEKSLNW